MRHETYEYLTLWSEMAEILRKLGLYFQDTYAYHVPSSLDTRPLTVETEPLGRYYMDETILLNFGHWSSFDEHGIPWRQSRDGSGFLHNYSTIACYALAHVDMYLLNGEQHHLDEVVKCCDYALVTVDRSNEVWRLKKEEIPTQGHSGRVSSIDHGLWMSVLCRA